MWKRGKRSRSNSLTRQPCWASRVETVLPAGPPPITTTSVVLELTFGSSLLMGLRDCSERQAIGATILAPSSHWLRNGSSWSCVITAQPRRFSAFVSVPLFVQNQGNEL